MSLGQLGQRAVALVVSLNLHRRHLSESQRGMVAAKLATLGQGARTDLAPIGGMSQAQAAQLLNVGERTIARGAGVLKSGSPELVHAVESGKVSVSAAADVRTGTKRDAILFSVGANATHGTRRTNEDKRRAVMTLFTNELVSKDDQGNPRSHRQIAAICAVHPSFVD